MSDQEKKQQKSIENTGQETNTRHSKKRRKVLRNITAATGVAAVGAGVKWQKPIVDSVLLPAHAQTSPAAPAAPTLRSGLSGVWFLGDDAPGGYTTGVSGTQTQGGGFLYDDGTDMRVRATVTPAQAIPVTVTVNGGTTSFGAVDSPIPTVTTNAATGVADFGTFEPTNGDFGDAPGTGAITVTLSSPGFVSNVITLNVS